MEMEKNSDISPIWSTFGKFLSAFSNCTIHVDIHGLGVDRFCQQQDWQCKSYDWFHLYNSFGKSKLDTDRETFISRLSADATDKHNFQIKKWPRSNRCLRVERGDPYSKYVLSKSGFWPTTQWSKVACSSAWLQKYSSWNLIKVISS